MKAIMLYLLSQVKEINQDGAGIMEMFSDMMKEQQTWCCQKKNESKHNYNSLWRTNQILWVAIEEKETATILLV